jgi:hypothetical protein
LGELSTKVTRKSFPSFCYNTVFGLVNFIEGKEKMYCPRCGQEQASPELRFCSRCGLPLNLVGELVSNNGFLPQLADLQKPKKYLTRKNVLKFGLVWFLLFTFLITPLLAIAGGEEIVALTAVLGFIGGILIMLFSLLFLKKDPKNLAAGEINQNINESPNFLSGNRGKNALPPQQSIPVSSYAPPPAGSWQSNTDDLQPTSVTEETTKLLKKDK